jgi:adenylosuccinate lyase
MSFTPNDIEKIRLLFEDGLKRAKGVDRVDKIKIRAKIRREISSISSLKNPTTDMVLGRWKYKLSEVFDIMKLSSLNTVSPVDGRYRQVAEKLADYFSEGALIKYRVRVEVEYFIALCNLPLAQLVSLRDIYQDFSIDDAAKIKEIEKITNHDVKAIEYFLKEQFELLGLETYKEFIHFGLTSQDINNTAIPWALKEAWLNVLEPVLDAVIESLEKKAIQWKELPMLARTHGQPALPTTLGKEIYVFVDRLKNQKKLLISIPFSAKFGGATGNFNAHHVAYPGIDWIAFGNYFVEKVLGLDRSRVTTQVEHYDNLAAFCDNMKRINTILIDLDRDVWSYVSMDYFKQRIKSEEIGSSAMPHKIFEHLSAKLPISRLQRDLTDSTVIRNIGVPLAHTLIGYKSLLRGLDKLILNSAVIRADLDDNWMVVAEAIQTILRREGYPEPFETLKSLTRTHSRIDQKRIIEFIESLDVSQAVKNELMKITPENYTGVFQLS